MEKIFEQYIGYVLILLVVIVLAYSSKGLFIDSDSNDYSIDNGNGDLNQAFNTASSGDTSPGGVSVDLTPEGVVNGKLEVKISVNTHSVDLSQFDLREITTLIYNEKIIKPISAPNLGGHHSNGKLVFDVDEDITDFTIKIKGIPKVEERIFEWGE